MTSRGRVRLWVAGAIAAIPLFVIANTELTLLRYRFGILDLESPPLLVAKVVVGSVPDSILLAANSLTSLPDGQQVSPTSELPTVELRVERGSLEALTSDLPQSAKARFYDAELLYPDGRWRRISYRLRGRSPFHWEIQKPSLRLKLRKRSPIDLQRHINLVNPEDRAMVSNPMGEWLARELGVLTHITDFVRVFINGEYRGVYHRTTREDEGMLRWNRRVPGPFYVGDELGPVWAADQFELAGDLSPVEVDPLALMVEALYMPRGPEQYERLWNIVSREQLARWQAAMNLAAGIHTDRRHNHLFYFDPTKGLLEPAVVDVNGHGLITQPLGIDRVKSRLFGTYAAAFDVPLNEKIQPLNNVAFRDPRFVHRRNEVLWEALHSVGSTESQHAKLREWFRKADADARADHRKGAIEAAFVGYYRFPYSNLQYGRAKQEVLEWVGNRNAFLLAELEDVEVGVEIGRAMNDGRRVFVVSVDGNAAVRFDPGALGALVSADRTFDGRFAGPLVGPELLHPGLRENEDYENWSGFDQSFLMPDAQRYAFAVEDLASDELARLLEGAFVHSLSGRRVVPEVAEVDAIDPGSVVYPDTVLHAWSLAEPPEREIVLGPGTVRIGETLYVGADQSLRVRPGTTLSLGAGVSLASRGRVHFEGTADEPIRVERLDPDRPWGAIIVQGPSTRGSRIEYTEVSGGSLASEFNVRYSGMVSIHGSDDLVIRGSTFRGNTLSDDTLHVVYGGVVLSDSTVRDCFGDCVDFDYCTGVVANVRIEDSANDGLDFMTSEFEISEARIARAGDKGISMGEGSTLEVRDAVIESSVTGIAVKDKSEAALRGARMAGNEVAIAVFAKNWRFGGPGRIRVSDVAFLENAVDLQIEDPGEVILESEMAPEKVAGDGKLIAAF